VREEQPSDAGPHQDYGGGFSRPFIEPEQMQGIAMEQQLRDCAANALSECLQLKREETLPVVCDPPCFAIGRTLDTARISGGLLEDEKVMGTIHVAIGDNASMGGTVKVPVHLDGVVRNPSVWLDGVAWMEDGTVLTSRAE
jgi:hypothetical protein